LDNSTFTLNNSFNSVFIIIILIAVLVVVVDLIDINLSWLLLVLRFTIHLLLIPSNIVIALVKLVLGFLKHGWAMVSSILLLLMMIRMMSVALLPSLVHHPGALILVVEHALRVHTLIQLEVQVRDLIVHGSELSIGPVAVLGLSAHNLWAFRLLPVRQHFFVVSNHVVKLPVQVLANNLLWWAAGEHGLFWFWNGVGVHQFLMQSVNFGPSIRANLLLRRALRFWLADQLDDSRFQSFILILKIFNNLVSWVKFWLWHAW